MDNFGGGKRSQYLISEELLKKYQWKIKNNAVERPEDLDCSIMLFGFCKVKLKLYLLHCRCCRARNCRIPFNAHWFVATFATIRKLSRWGRKTENLKKKKNSPSGSRLARRGHGTAVIERCRCFPPRRRDEAEKNLWRRVCSWTPRGWAKVLRCLGDRLGRRDAGPSIHWCLERLPPVPVEDCEFRANFSIGQNKILTLQKRSAMNQKKKKSFKWI